jgi:hypothetical protein
MRRFMVLLGIIVAAIALGGAPSAVAANPGPSRFTFTGSGPPDTDFCGTGQTVLISVSVKATEFSAPNQPVDSRSIAEVDVVYTNPANGAIVVRHSAGPVSDTIISGDPAGMHTVERTVKGLTGLLRTADGAVLLGAGYLVLHEVFNGEEFVSRTIVVDKGPHPNIESDLTQETDLPFFCDAATAALGLS